MSDDYHLTACLSLMKFFVAKYGRRYIDSTPQTNNAQPSSLLANPSSLLSISCKSTSAVLLNSPVPATDSDSDSGPPTDTQLVDENDNVSANTNHNSNMSSDVTVDAQLDSESSVKYYTTRSSTTKNRRLSVKTLELAIDHCQKFISDFEHCDLDAHEQVLSPNCTCSLVSTRINSSSFVTGHSCTF